MSSEREQADKIRRLWSGGGKGAADVDYVLLGRMEGSFVARSRDNRPALVVPLVSVGSDTAGQRAAGLELKAHPATRLIFGEQDVTSPAAGLVCTNKELVGVFSLLAVDVAKRVAAGRRTWEDLLACVDEWQALLAPRGRPSIEAEAGLWGELWFLDQARDLDSLLSGWRGPDKEAVDFFLGGRGAEIKTSRHCRQHHVSHSQVGEPLGEHPTWLLSLWVKQDPLSKVNVASLAHGIESRATHASDALKRLTRAGFRPQERDFYTTTFSLLAEPEWFAMADVPRVRTADKGVTDLRYRIILDESKRVGTGESAALWKHFHAQPYAGGNR